MINMPGGPEIFVIFLVALIVLGPQELPKVMRTIGSAMAEIRKISSSFQAEVQSAMDAIVDTSAEEKPHSATMAPADPEAPTDSDPVDEVVVRHEGSEIDGASPTEGTDASHVDGAVAVEATDSTPPEPQRAPIDPVDRAAG